MIIFLRMSDLIIIFLLLVEIVLPLVIVLKKKNRIVKTKTVMDKWPELWNIGIWIVSTKSCTHVKIIVYFVLDIILNIKQSKENMI